MIPERFKPLMEATAAVAEAKTDAAAVQAGRQGEQREFVDDAAGRARRDAPGLPGWPCSRRRPR